MQLDRTNSFIRPSWKVDLRSLSSSPACYLASTIIVGLAWLATAILQPFALGHSLWLIFFFTAIAISSSIGGLRAGVLATVLSALLCDFFFLPPYHSLAVARRDMPFFILFVAVALLINSLTARLQSARRAADLRFQELVDGLDGIVWNADPLTLRYSFVSRQAEAILGYPIEQWMSDQDFRSRILHMEDKERVLSIYRELGIQDGYREIEYRVSTARGEERWIRETVRVSHDEHTNSARMTGLCVDITEQKRAAEQVLTGRERLQLISRRLVEVQEVERRQIARELHDEVGQVLTALKFSLEMCGRQAQEETRQSLREPVALLNDLMKRVSDLSLDLRPAMLDDMGLVPALLWQFDRLKALTGLQVEFEHTDLEERFSQTVETTAYRIVQEALTNVARHAGVTQATVRIWTTETHVGLQVVDSGCGFDTEAALDSASSGGLMGMNERATLIDGWLTVESSVGHGTCLTAELPLTSPNRQSI